MRTSQLSTRLKVFLGDEATSRRGAFLVLTAFCLMFCFAFVSLAVDIGYVNLVKQRMQNAVDAAALAAAQEIIAAVNNAPPDVEDITQYVLNEARNVAALTSQLNGVFISNGIDVEFGQRTYNEASGAFEIAWGSTPANVVKVISRRENEDSSAPDGKLPLFFAGIIGKKYTSVRAEAVAFVQARDLVVVHDFSRSMNFDSYFATEANTYLSKEQILANLQAFYASWNPNVGPDMPYWPKYLEVNQTSNSIEGKVRFRYNIADVETNGNISSVTIRYSNGSQQTLSGSGSSGTFRGTGSNENRDITRVTVQVSKEVQNADVNQNPVLLTGAAPVWSTQAQIYVYFSGDRKSVYATADKDLSNVVLEFCDGVHYKFDGLRGTSGWFWGIGANADKVIKRVWVKSGSNFSNDGPGYGERFVNPTAGQDCDANGTTLQEATLVFDDTNANVMQMLGLNGRPYPYPSGSWNEFINHARNDVGLRNAGFREMYGGLSYANYVLRHQSGGWQTPDLWKTRHYPFHAVKEGHTLFCNFLENLGFDDHVGMVSYDTSHRQEKILNHPDPAVPNVDISSQPITTDYQSVINLMKYRQAANYSYATNMGGGMQDAIDMLKEHARGGTQRAILLMTDGNTNVMDPGANASLPSNWNWNELLDMNGDGQADFYTSDPQFRYVLRLAFEARNAGVTIHTMSVGVDANVQLMKAIAHIGNGHAIVVPGGVSASQMEAELLDAFHRIASFVPPAKLLQSE